MGKIRFTVGARWNTGGRWIWKKLRPVCEMFLGTHDFRGFCSAKANLEDTVRTIHCCEVKRQGDLVVFTIEGDGF